MQYQFSCTRHPLYFILHINYQLRGPHVNLSPPPFLFSPPRPPTYPPASSTPPAPPLFSGHSLPLGAPSSAGLSGEPPHAGDRNLPGGGRGSTVGWHGRPRRRIHLPLLPLPASAWWPEQGNRVAAARAPSQPPTPTRRRTDAPAWDLLAPRRRRMTAPIQGRRRCSGHGEEGHERGPLH